jgi:hypothetical protein
VSKVADFYLDFKNIILPQQQKAPKKVLIIKGKIRGFPFSKNASYLKIGFHWINKNFPETVGRNKTKLLKPNTIYCNTKCAFFKTPHKTFYFHNNFGGCFEGINGIFEPTINMVLNLSTKTCQTFSGFELPICSTIK